MFNYSHHKKALQAVRDAITEHLSRLDSHGSTWVSEPQYSAIADATHRAMASACAILSDATGRPTAQHLSASRDAERRRRLGEELATKNRAPEVDEGVQSFIDHVAKQASR